MTTRPTIYCDEAGNTGAHLLDPEQPVFALASVDFSREEAQHLLAHIYTHQTKEAKFSSLRKNAAGIRRLEKFFQDPLLQPNRIKTSFFVKRFMVVTKIMDLLLEELAHRTDFNFYERGQNIALSNLTFFCTPVFCSKQGFETFLDRFVRMVRSPERSNIKAFYDSVRALIAESKNAEFRKVPLELIAFTEGFIESVLEHNDYSTLDPAVPAFFTQAATWGTVYRNGFDVIHDASKPIASHKGFFERVSSIKIPEEVVGFDRRTFELPLKMRSLTFGTSEAYPELQVADLIASGGAAIGGTFTGKATNPTLEALLKAADLARFSVNMLWPSLAVSPTELGTDGGGALNPNERISQLLQDAEDPDLAQHR